MMGNKTSQFKQSTIFIEMYSSREFSRHKLTTESLCSLQELWLDCLALKDGTKNLTDAIEDIFVEEDDDDQEEVYEMEERLLSIIRSNQNIVHKVTRNLEQHANVVNQGVQNNEDLIVIVKELVLAINSYMTMLIRNVWKMKRLISEISSMTEWATLTPHNTIYDVISYNQDVDVMLDQLLETERHREDLEEDIVSVLVCWRSYRYLLLAGEKSGSQIDSSVKTAAKDVARCLAHLKRCKR
uniref:Uncharacterized protein n=1 Tax=Arion vulgaris TaxID=1028688 RepID=A0A0B6ZT78_9EUPU